MYSFKKENLQNIKGIFQAKTGVSFAKKNNRFLFRKIATVAAVMVCCLTLSAFAINIFSAFSGDELILSALYKGNGVIEVTIDNRSEKELTLQPELKLMYGRYRDEVASLGGDVLFDETVVPAASTRRILIDVSSAYDVAELEKPLSGDYYYLLLTNDGFLTGQKWACNIIFKEGVQSGSKNQSSFSDEAGNQDILLPLQPYFAADTWDIFQRRTLAYEYFELVEEILELNDTAVVESASPSMFVGEAEDDTQKGMSPRLNLDLTAAQESFAPIQLSVNWHNLDAYGKAVGANDREKALVIAANIGEEGIYDLPLLYFFVYPAEQAVEGGSVFIRGRIMTIEQLLPHLVYSDKYYNCYEVTDLFYGDIHNYLKDISLAMTGEELSSLTVDILESIYLHYRDRSVINSCFYYLESRIDQ